MSAIVENARRALDVGKSSGLEELERYSNWLQSGGPSELLDEVERLIAQRKWMRTHLQICAVSWRARGNAEAERDMLDMLAAMDQQDAVGDAS